MYTWFYKKKLTKCLQDFHSALAVTVISLSLSFKLKMSVNLGPCGPGWVCPATNQSITLFHSCRFRFPDNIYSVLTILVSYHLLLNPLSMSAFVLSMLCLFLLILSSTELLSACLDISGLKRKYSTHMSYMYVWVQMKTSH